MIRSRVQCLLLAAALGVPAHAAMWIPTNYGIGADAEVRESQPVTNRGASTEIASRVRNDAIAGTAGDANDRNSAIYVKIDLTDTAMPGDGHTAFRLTYRNNNLNGGRIQDTVTPNSDLRTGMTIYGLNNAALGNWDESTITYLNAPGITLDGDVGTKDFNSDLTFLGNATFPDIGTQNHLPIGGALILQSDALDQFVANALAGGANSVTLVATTIHGGDAPLPLWRNFNYLFNPKEQTTLNGDNYDAGDGNGDIGNLFSTDNSTGDFSPALLLIPEPGSAALLAAASTALLARRRRR